MFFPDPARGLAEFRRVPRPGRHVAVCVISLPERGTDVGHPCRGPEPVSPEQRKALHLSFALGAGSQLEQLLDAAGFRDVCLLRIRSVWIGIRPYYLSRVWRKAGCGKGLRERRKVSGNSARRLAKRCRACAGSAQGQQLHAAAGPPHSADRSLRTSQVLSNPFSRSTSSAMRNASIAAGKPQ
jgi:hypothetical protein